VVADEQTLAELGHRVDVVSPRTFGEQTYGPLVIPTGIA
jgi:hypothetical protein